MDSFSSEIKRLETSLEDAQRAKRMAEEAAAAAAEVGAGEKKEGQASVQRLETECALLREQLEDTTAKLARLEGQYRQVKL